MPVGLRLVVLVIGVLTALDAHSRTPQVESAVAVVKDEAAFLAAVRANLVRAQQSGHLFSYRERRTKLHTNPFGRLGTGRIELSQVYPSTHAKLTYRRVLERDGQALSAQDLAQQDREYLARAAAVRHRLENESASDRRRRLDEEARAAQRSQAMIEDVVSALDITITGRGVHEGTPAITVAFAGIPSARPKTREGRIAQKFVGTAWIHPVQHELMHVEAMTTDDVSFGFGLVARLGKGTTGSLTRRPVAPGFWMPTTMRLSGAGRALLHLRRLEIDMEVEWFDYRPFDGVVPVTPWRLPED
jgi:hypothetical protein